MKQRLSGKQKARIWFAVVQNTAPTIRAIASLLAVLFITG